MKNFVRGVLEKSPLKVRNDLEMMVEHAAPLVYNYSSFRWHLDSRAATKVIAVHDFLSSSNFWQNALNKTIATLPLSQLTLKEPLEVYAVDLRGHNLSEKLMVDSENENYASLCAADIARLQRDVVVCKSQLIGVGFGAMVSCLVALHRQDSFHAVTLLVRNFSDLYQFVPNSYAFLEIIEKAPQETKSISAMNEYLKTKVPHPLDREFLLSNVKEISAGVRFGFDQKILKLKNEIGWSKERLGRVQYPGPVKVILYGGIDPSKEEIETFKVNFPQATFHSTIKTDRGLLDSTRIGKIFIDALEIVGPIQSFEDESISNKEAVKGLD